MSDQAAALQGLATRAVLLRRGFRRAVALGSRRCLVGGELGLDGPVWSAVGALNDNFGTLGYLIIAIFALSWLVSITIYRIRGYDAIEVSGQG